MAGNVALRLILTLVIFTVHVLCAKKPAEILRHSVTRHGYPVELHKVTTQDGYILSLVRIPGKSDKAPVLIVHGLLSSSVDWTVQGPDKSISFIAADEGYDVWLGNVRGNTFSKEHKTFSSKDREYWQFSFHEIGMYDIPAMVDYIRSNTSSDTVHYIGHSQGGTVFLVMASMRPAYNKKFASVHLLAPAAYIYHATSPAVDFASRIDELEMFAKLTRSYEIGGRGPGSSMDLVYAGHKTGLVPTSLVLTNIWYLVGVHDSINRTVLGEILANTPAGCSVYQLLHFGQNYLAKAFQLYDYGRVANMQRYGAKIPPEYPLHNVTAPIMLYYSAGDNFVPPEDVEELADQLPNVVHKHRIGLRKWNHIDYMFDASAHRLYRMIVASLRNQSTDENRSQVTH
ncbi:lipase 3-like [Anopheles funestus]|uniref:lipase 3-like n=1 Tax=Anopheles funestus TaxID=62324 RepID=UPI0020C745DA|nr:lipase 3-like [Anopheles funestus]